MPCIQLLWGMTRFLTGAAWSSPHQTFKIVRGASGQGALDGSANDFEGGFRATDAPPSSLGVED